ncbi:MAG: hypothetical protein K2Y37_08920 [Pirellulales bacterium]|nr:hypothetical protein [Pirellulales bacterium]
MVAYVVLRGGILLASASSSRGAEPFVPVEQGQPACLIVIAKNPNPAVRLAALELQFHVLKIAGAELPIRSEDTPTKGRRILVGDSSAAAELGFRVDEFAPQLCRLSVRHVGADRPLGLGPPRPQDGCPRPVASDWRRPPCEQWTTLAAAFVSQGCGLATTAWFWIDRS